MNIQLSEIKPWSVFINKVRRFFEKKKYLEVFTRSLVPIGAFEGTLDCIEVKHVYGDLYLHTSPELEMKSLMSELKSPIFQITHCFRDDPATPVHFKEFTMLEFYTPYEDYRHSQQLIQELFEFLADKELKFERYSVAEAFDKWAGLRLIEELSKFKREIQEKQVIVTSPMDSWDDLYFKVLIEKIEPALSRENPTFLYDYPVSQAVLAEVNPLSGMAERFEVYWRGIELCNGCSELKSRDELFRRYQNECAKRKFRGKPIYPFPDKLAETMDPNLPYTGVAVGLERLFFCLYRQGFEFG